MGYIKERESTGHVYGLDLKGGVGVGVEARLSPRF